MHVVRFRIQDSCFKIQTQKNYQKPVENHFSVKHPCRARLCLQLFFHFLQTSLQPAEEHLQTALAGYPLQKRKTTKTLALLSIGH